MVVAADQVLRGVRNLPLVRAVSRLLLRIGDDGAVLTHDSADHLPGNDDGNLAGPELMCDVAVASRAAGAPEDLTHGRARPRILVGPLQRPAPAIMGALRYHQGSGELARASSLRRPQLVYDRGLLPFFIAPGLAAFKTLAAALNMSFSSPGCRTRSSRPPSRPSKALSQESPMGAIGLPSAAARLGFSAAPARLQASAAPETPSISATSLPAMLERTNATACALSAGS